MINLNYSIVKYPNHKLLLKSYNVDNFNEELDNTITAMKNTMILNNGVGLAAVQIGILKNICIIVDQKTNKIIEFINPIFLFKSLTQTNEIEGCLSIPNRYEYIKRPKKIIIKAYNKFGRSFEKTFYGFNAKILCHEIDHLNGILFIDHINKIDIKENI